MPPYARIVGSLIKIRSAREASLRNAAVGLALTIALLSPAGALPAPASPAGAAPPDGLIAVCVNGNPWVDGGFEATSATNLTDPNYPVVSSFHFPSGHPGGTPPTGTPLCNVGYSDCQNGTNGLATPRTGSSWAWFGGYEGFVNAEIASAQQTITFPSGATSATLKFYLRIGVVASPFTDTLEVQVDGATQQTYLEPSTPEASYTLRSIDLTAFADGTAHDVKFLYTNVLSGAPNKANFDVDDVTLDIACAPLTPTALAVDSSGNGVLEPGEVAAVKPTWKNDSGSQIILTGDSSNFTGPAGPTYGNPDTAADYGTVGAGASAQCAGCYTVQATGSRPAAEHWDATIDEATGAATKTWTLHVGASFADVPSNYVFYSFIENIFHHAITAGCGAPGYCPGVPALRSHMAVFLLKAKEGPLYAPPACASLFFDVPCPSLYANWIEELYNRQITGGCSDTPLMYCPDAPVLREQMAVFLLKTLEGNAYAPPACASLFTDVPCPSLYANWIEELFNRQITAGCNAQGAPAAYCPADPNTRGQMAVFLTKTFGLLLYGP